MHDGRSDGVTRAVEGLEHDHAVGIGDVAVTQNAQAGDGKGDDERIVGKETNDRLGKDDEKDADDAELWEWSPAKDEARVENEIDDVGDPEQTHGDGGVTCAAEDGVVEK